MPLGSFSAKKKERVAMKKRYQIDQQRAVQQFRRLATEQNPNIQMILPMADIVGLLQEGVGNLLRHAPFDAQLRRRGEGLSIRLWNREVGGERELH